FFAVISTPTRKRIVCGYRGVPRSLPHCHLCRSAKSFLAEPLTLPRSPVAPPLQRARFQNDVSVFRCAYLYCTLPPNDCEPSGKKSSRRANRICCSSGLPLYCSTNKISPARLPSGWSSRAGPVGGLNVPDVY